MDNENGDRPIAASVTFVGFSIADQPGFAQWRRRLQRHRRPVAAGLAALSVLAVIGAVSDSGASTAPVVVAAVDIPAGTTLTESDLRIIDFPIELIPETASTDPSLIAGEVVTAGILPGEVITSARLLGQRPEAGRGRVAAPVRLADAGVAGLLAPGDRVDIIAASADGEARVIARAARVITRPIPPATFGTQTGSLVVLSVTSDEATALAGVATTRQLSAVLQ